eukprot:Rmarinus@m.14921
MPKIRTLSRRTQPPAGFEAIEPTLNEFENKMREVENDPHEGKRRVEGVWPVTRVHHQRSRFIYESYYKKKVISREVYDYCLRMKYADASLIAKWKKPGYERLCCLTCVQTRDHNFATACICRVPREKLEDGKVVECVTCGCRGCASGDS